MEALDPKDVDKNTRILQYKTRPQVEDQEVRRLNLLDEQKRRREDNFNNARNIAEIFDEDTEDDEEYDHDDDSNEFMEWKSDKPKLPRLKDMFMFSEWMIKLPDNLQDKWLFTLCPVGKRCLVRSSKGCTKVYSKYGHQLAKFQSLLPNGCKYNHNKSRYSNSEITLLDCIWSSATKSYYILDLLCWKDQSYLETDVGFRNFWVKSKVMEDMPYLLERSSKNPYPFIPLQFYSCEPSIITSQMLRYPYFENNEPKVDGILFYHKDGLYMPGSTPLVIWLKPFMLPEIFCDTITIANEHLNDLPIDYVDMMDYISKFDKRQLLTLQKQKERKKKKYYPDAEMEELGDKLLTENEISNDIVGGNSFEISMVTT